MSNIPHCRSVKLEKENENLELKRKQKKNSNLSKNQPVWNRLSKLRKNCDFENNSARNFTKCRQFSSGSYTLGVKSQQYGSTDPYALTSYPHYADDGRKLENSPTLPAVSQNTACRSSKQLPISSRKTSSATKNKLSPRFVGLVKTKSMESLIKRGIAVGNTEFEDEYELRVPLKGPASIPKSRSHTIEKLDEVKYEPKAPLIEPVTILKSKGHLDNIIKADIEKLLDADNLEGLENIKNLDRSDTKHYRNALKSKLQNITKYERALKNFLNRSESNSSIPSTRQTIQKETQTDGDFQNIIRYKPSTYGEHYQYDVDDNDPNEIAEVDVIFKNVPSLEKEITILKTLGEKLEATLQKNSAVSLKSTCSTAQTKSFVSLAISSGVVSVIDESEDRLYLLMEIKKFNYILGVENTAHSYVYPIGLMRSFAVAQEFIKVEKSILEMKLEANKAFYISTTDDDDDGDNVADSNTRFKKNLKKTSFRKLKANPEVFVKHLKAQDPIKPFNILDQDPVFFNSIFLNKMQNSLTKKHMFMRWQESLGHTDYNIKKALCESGNTEPPEEPVHVVKSTKSSGKLKLKKSTENKRTLKKSVELRNQNLKRSIKRITTPMSPHKYTSPKNNLIRTILVGSVQISIFMLLIMAITFPDIKC